MQRHSQTSSISAIFGTGNETATRDVKINNKSIDLLESPGLNHAWRYQAIAWTILDVWITESHKIHL